MQVAFDHQMFSLQKMGGISRIFVELMKRIPGQSEIELSWFRGNGIDELGEPSWIQGLDHYRRISLTGEPVTSGERDRLNWKGLAEFTNKLPGDWVYHPTYYSQGALEIAGSQRMILTVADLIAERFFGEIERFQPHLKGRRQLIERADLILVISERTRQDLMDIHGVPAARIKTTYLASDMGKWGGEAGLATEGKDRPYFLWVGTRSKYKNFELLLDAYVNHPSLHDFDVRVFGGTGPLLEPELKKLKAAGLQDRFQYLRGDDRALEVNYRGAEGLVYTSRYEGFGLPPLEAMQCGCPVICCPVGSLPEVVGEAAAFVSPDDPGELADNMLKVASDREWRKELVSGGYERAALFSWDRTAHDTLSAYRSLAG